MLEPSTVLIVGKKEQWTKTSMDSMKTESI